MKLRGCMCSRRSVGVGDLYFFELLLGYEYASCFSLVCAVAIHGCAGF
jgi:hypothetical protein